MYSIRTDDSALSKLMSDFYCTKADNIFYKELSDKVSVTIKSRAYNKHQIKAVLHVEGPLIAESLNSS